MARPVDIWLAAGVRTPFAKVDGPLQALDALELSVPVARHMAGLLKGGRPDFAVWGVVVPNLLWSNLAREVLMDAGIDPRTPAFSTIMACSTSMIGAIEAAGMLDGDSLQPGAGRRRRQPEPHPVRAGPEAVRLAAQVPERALARPEGRPRHAPAARATSSLYIPAIVNRTTGMSMGEHTEITAKEWQIGRQEQDAARAGKPSQRHRRLGEGLLRRPRDPVGDTKRDTIPRKDTSLERLAKLPPTFDRTSGQGSLTAGNSSPLTDGAAAIWVATSKGLARLPAAHRA